MLSVGWITPYLDSGTTYQRCHLPARLLAEAGWETAVSDAIGFDDADGRIRLPASASDVKARLAASPLVGLGSVPTICPDAVVISWWGPQQGDPGPPITAAKAAGQTILLDVDDNPYARRGHCDPAWSKLIRLCDGVLVTTQALKDQLDARWHGRPPVRVVATLYDPTPYQWPSRALRPSWGAAPWPLLGFRGGLQWHRTDAADLRRLRDLAPFVHLGHDKRRWACDCGKYVGHEAALAEAPVCSCGQPMVDGIPTLEEITKVSVARRFATHSYRRYAHLLAAVAPYVTVGVIPLDMTSFAEAKTHIGAFEWSAVGVPWVASATAEYSRLAGPLSGTYLVRKARDWPRKVGALLADPELRRAVMVEQRGAAEKRRAHAGHWELALRAMTTTGVKVR